MPPAKNPPTGTVVTTNPPQNNNDPQSRISTDEKEWIVQVIRQTSEGRVRMEARNSEGKLVPVAVQVKRGSITIPRVKMRLELNSRRNDKANEKNANITVRRRRDTVAIGGDGRMQRILLKFRSEKECRDFSDHFVALNPPAILAASTKESLAADQIEESGEALSYMMRLLNEPEFVSYVDHLENYLMSSEDGQQMLNAFV
jgi:hypothetical protein